jgi:hypothetical protein
MDTKNSSLIQSKGHIKEGEKKNFLIELKLLFKNDDTTSQRRNEGFYSTKLHNMTPLKVNHFKFNRRQIKTSKSFIKREISTFGMKALLKKERNVSSKRKMRLRNLRPALHNSLRTNTRHSSP